MMRSVRARRTTVLYFHTDTFDTFDDPAMTSYEMLTSLGESINIVALDYRLEDKK